MKLGDQEDHICELNQTIGKLHFMLHTLLVNPHNRVNRDAVIEYLGKNPIDIGIAVLDGGA